MSGSFALGRSGEPLLDGFKALFGTGTAKALALVAIVGLISSFHTIIFAQGRQIYSLSRAGYFPTFLSVTHGTRKTPQVAMIFGAVIGLSIMLVIFVSLGAETGSVVIGGTLLNMAVFGAMCSYIAQVCVIYSAAQISRTHRAAIPQRVRHARCLGDNRHCPGHDLLSAER